jgi:esterase/lipase
MTTQTHLFIDPQLDYSIPDNLNFADYLNRCKTLISKARPNATPDIIEANMPFELRPNQPARIGVLLIHGLLETPYAMRDIGHQLQTQGMLVRAILLPGHGTTPSSLLNVSYKDWMKSVEYGIQSLSQEVEKIFLVGDSTGGSLALHYALKNDPRIAAALLLSPALKIRSPIDFATQWLRHLGNKWNRAKWYLLLDEIDYGKYQSISFNAAYQVYSLGQKILQLATTQQPTCPLFFALSQDDKTIASKITLNHFQQNKNPQNRMILYTHTPQLITDKRITPRPAAYPTLHIADISHVAIPIAPDNPRYGMQGTCSYASHVNKTSDVIYGSFNKAEVLLREQLFRYHLVKTRYQNITFNPDFEFLVAAIREFIDPLCQQP